jgi:hypothetical protein
VCAGKETFCVLANQDAVSLKARNAINRGEYDVVDVGWFYHCVEQSKLFPWFVRYMLFVVLKIEVVLSKQMFVKSGYSIAIVLATVTESSK